MAVRERFLAVPNLRSYSPLWGHPGRRLEHSLAVDMNSLIQRLPSAAAFQPKET